MVTNVALALAHSLGREQQRRKVSIGVALWVLEQYGMGPNVHLGDFGGDEERNQQHMVHHSTTGILAGIYTARVQGARGGHSVYVVLGRVCLAAVGIAEGFGSRARPHVGWRRWVEAGT